MLLLLHETAADRSHQRKLGYAMQRNARHLRTHASSMTVDYLVTDAAPCAAEINASFVPSLAWSVAVVSISSDDDDPQISSDPSVHSDVHPFTARSQIASHALATTAATLATFFLLWPAAYCLQMWPTPRSAEERIIALLP